MKRQDFNDQKYRIDEDHPSLNPTGFGYSKTCNIPDEFRYTPTKYSCPICKNSKCSPYAYTRDTQSLSEIFEKLTGTTETVEVQEISHHGVS